MERFLEQVGLHHLHLPGFRETFLYAHAESLRVYEFSKIIELTHQFISPVSLAKTGEFSEQEPVRKPNYPHVRPEDAVHRLGGRLAELRHFLHCRVPAGSILDIILKPVFRVETHIEGFSHGLVTGTGRKGNKRLSYISYAPSYGCRRF